MSDVIDKAELMDRIDNDLEFLAETVELYQQDCPTLLGGIRSALQSQDSDGVATAAHTLKGLVSNFCARSTVEAALKLEMMGKHNDLDGGAEALAALERETQRLQEALEELLQGNEP
jgi:HPt (histidine-containing phosphotransfer) domain-containing protein